MFEVTFGQSEQMDGASYDSTGLTRSDGDAENDIELVGLGENVQL